MLKSQIKNPSNIKSEISEEDLEEFENYCKTIGINKIGYANLTPETIIGPIPEEYTKGIIAMIAINPKNDDTGTDKTPEELEEKTKSLFEGILQKTYQISDFLRKKGYQTYSLRPTNVEVHFKKLAQHANLGYIAKNDLIITPEYLSEIRMAGILTNINNLPIKTENQYKWIREYCDTCEKCIEKCPEDALTIDPVTKNTRMIRELCPAHSDGCRECMDICPFYIKGYENIKKEYINL